MTSSMEQAVIERMRSLTREQQRKVLEYVEGISRQAPARKSIFEEIREIVKDVPDEVWAQLPEDGSENLDHYLYGSPKK